MIKAHRIVLLFFFSNVTTQAVAGELACVLARLRERQEAAYGARPIKADFSSYREGIEQTKRHSCQEAVKSPKELYDNASRGNELAVEAMRKGLLQAGYREGTHFTVHRGTAPGQLYIEFLVPKGVDVRGDALLEFILNRARLDQVTITYWPWVRDFMHSGAAAIFAPQPRVMVVSEQFLAERVSHYEHHESMHGIVHRLRRLGRETPYHGEMRGSSTSEELGAYEVLSFDELAAYPHGIRHNVERLRPDRYPKTEAALREEVRTIDLETAITQQMAHDIYFGIEGMKEALSKTRASKATEWVITGGDASPEVLDFPNVNVTRSRMSNGTTITIKIDRPGGKAGEKSEMSFDLTHGRDAFDRILDKNLSPREREIAMGELLNLLQKYTDQLQRTALLANHRAADLRAATQATLQDKSPPNQRLVYDALRGLSQSLVKVTARGLALRPSHIP